MDNGNIMPQGESGQIVPEPIEVMRRAEFVFEPFMGSLVQMPESRAAQVTQETDMFPHSSPLQIEIAPAPMQAEVVCEKAAAGSGSLESEIGPWESQGKLTLEAAETPNAISLTSR